MEFFILESEFLAWIESSYLCADSESNVASFMKGYIDWSYDHYNIIYVLAYIDTLHGWMHWKMCINFKLLHVGGVALFYQILTPGQLNNNYINFFLLCPDSFKLAIIVIIKGENAYIHTGCILTES